MPNLSRLVDTSILVDYLRGNQAAKAWLNGFPYTEQQMHKFHAEKQTAITQLVLDELADEKLWDQAFGASQDKLAKLAAKVRQDIQAGRVKRMGIDEL